MRTANDCALRRAREKMGLHGLARTLVCGPMLAAAGVLAGCNQDSYASAPERDTHMGDVHAAPDLSDASSAASAAAPVAAPPAAPQPPIPGTAPAAPTGASPDAGASTSGPSPAVPAGSAKEPRTRPAAPLAPGKATP